MGCGAVGRGCGPGRLRDGGTAASLLSEIVAGPEFECSERRRVKPSGRGKLSLDIHAGSLQAQYEVLLEFRGIVSFLKVRHAYRKVIDASPGLRSTVNEYLAQPGPPGTVHAFLRFINYGSDDVTGGDEMKAFVRDRIFWGRRQELGRKASEFTAVSDDVGQGNLSKLYERSESSKGCLATTCLRELKKGAAAVSGPRWARRGGVTVQTQRNRYANVPFPYPDTHRHALWKFRLV